MRRRLRIGRLILLVLAVLVLGAAAVGYGFYRQGQDTLLAVAAHNPPPFQHTVTFLLLGEGLIENGNQDNVNPVNEPDQTDTMMLLAVNPTTGQAGLVSIPRDTEVNLPQAGGLAKINDANFVGGPTLAVKTVEQTLNVPVDFYAETTMANFAQIIDTIGGLDVYVPYPMNYGTATGPYSYLNIHLTQGMHHLNGYQVLQFVRFRNEALGDIGRIQQQQYIVRLILQKLLTPSELPHLPRVLSLLRQDLNHTNLSDTELAALAVLARKIHLSDIRYATLPGDPQTIRGISYWQLDTALLPLIEHDVLLDQSGPQDYAGLHVEVASGTSSLQPAQTVMNWLKAQGFSVSGPYWANQHNLNASVITNYTGDKYLGARLAAALGGSKAATVNNIPYHDVPGVDLVITVGNALHLDPKATL